MMKINQERSSVFKNIFRAACLIAVLLGSATATAAASLTALATPSNAAAPANVTLSVTVNADPDPVTVTQVEYFNGIAPLGVAITPPFSLALNNVAAGTYSIVAKATVDNPEHAVLVSNPVALTVTGSTTAGANVYYIQTDQLNTPRAITDQNSVLVWTWESDAFGKLPPNETPVSSTRFTFNPRFPGQYFDKESNLHYNYFRDYDPQTGRYVQSDPIGLRGGVNTYGYVRGNPLTYVDPYGLDSQENKTAISTLGLVGAALAARTAQDAFGDARNSGLPGAHNGPQDAFRHCVWQCRMTENFGARSAKKIGDEHENAGDRGRQPSSERAMDEANNAVGRQCGQQNDDQSCAQRCMSKYSAGSLFGLGGMQMAPPVPTN